jgi:hypothetical protein
MSAFYATVLTNVVVRFVLLKKRPERGVGAACSTVVRPTLTRDFGPFEIIRGINNEHTL